MSTEANKRQAARFLELLASGELPEVMALFTDDLVYWIAGKPGTVPTCGEKSKKQMERMFGAILSGLDGRLQMTARSMVAEGDRVAIEVVGYGRLKNGRVYNNEYHMLLTFRDGRICAVREYLDTQHVWDTWYRPEESQASA